jgi:hypothetical protein
MWFEGFERKTTTYVSIASLKHPNAKPVLPTVFGDNSLKRHRGMFETNAPKNN